MKTQSLRLYRRTLARISTAVLAAILVAACSSTDSDSSTNLTDNESSQSTDSADAVAASVCDEAIAQLSTLEGGDEIIIRQCESQTNSAGDVAFVLRLNDPTSWTQILATRSTEEITFTIPLALLAYSFAGSSQDPLEFDHVLIVFDDPDQTVYDMNSSDLAETLQAETQEEASVALQTLAQKMRITTLR